MALSILSGSYFATYHAFPAPNRVPAVASELVTRATENRLKVFDARAPVVQHKKYPANKDKRQNQNQIMAKPGHPEQRGAHRPPKYRAGTVSPLTTATQRR